MGRCRWVSAPFTFRPVSCASELTPRNHAAPIPAKSGYYEQAGAGRNEQAEGPASDGAGSGTIKNVEGGSQDLGQAAAPGYDDEMPKIDPATRVQQFLLGDAFQTEFDEWAARMEKEHGGKLEMTHEEIIHDGARILIWWRIVPRHHVTGTRR